MHRINRRDLEIELSGRLRVALRQLKPLLRPNRLPHESDMLVKALAEEVIQYIDCDHRMIIQTERRAGADSHATVYWNTWGVDEPDPTK